MTKSSSQSTELSWNPDNEKTWWNQRSTLERRLIIALVIFVVFIIGYLSYLYIRPKEISIESESCTTSTCLIAATDIIVRIDTSVDPCDDFFKFTCGSLTEITQTEEKDLLLEGIDEEMERQVTEILKEPVSDDDPFIIKSQKEYFQACMNETAVEEESIDIIKSHLKKLGGWPVVLGHIRWKEGLFDWTRMTYKLKRLGYHYESMLGFDVIPDPETYDKRVIRINEPNIDEIKEEHQELYKNYMTDVAVAFGAEKNQAKIEMEKVFDFMNNLRKVADKNHLEPNDTELNRFTIDEYQDFNYRIDWLDFLSNIVYPIANISESDYVVFPNEDFSDAFFSLIRRTRKRIQANYMVWALLENLMPFLPKRIQALRDSYKCMIEESSDERFDYCKRMAHTSFSPSPTVIMYIRKYLPEDKRTKVESLLSSIKAEFKNLLTETTWMDDKSRDKSVEKIDSLAEVIDAPIDYLNDTIFDSYKIDEDENSEDKSFLSMHLKRNIIENDLIFEELNLSLNDSQVGYDDSEGSVLYSPRDNALILPIPLLQEVLYDPERPMYLNYGSIGSIIAGELTYGFNKEGSQFDKNGEENKIWTEDTEKAYEDKVDCMSKVAEDLDLEDAGENINETSYLNKYIADFTGIKVAYAAYKKWVEENGEETQLPAIDYTPQQLFWIISISHKCYKIGLEKLNAGTDSYRYTHGFLRATVALRNNQDFADDFGCPVDSNMNPSEKCEIF